MTHVISGDGILVYMSLLEHEPDTDPSQEAAADPGTPETETGDRTAEIADVVASVREVHRSGRTASIEWRLDQLDGLIRMLDEHAERFERALADDLGKPGVPSN